MATFACQPAAEQSELSNHNLVKQKMARRSSNGQIFVGRLSKKARSRDLEDLFESYGRLERCDIKYGAEMAYAFIDYEDRRDAEDAVKKANGREVCGSSIIVEWAKGRPRQTVGSDECYKCHRPGHWSRDCPSDSGRGYRRRRSPSPRRRSPPKKRRRSRSPSVSDERKFKYSKKESSRHNYSDSRSSSRSVSPSRSWKRSKPGKSYTRHRSRSSSRS